MEVLAVMENHDHEKLNYHLKVNQLMYHDVTKIHYYIQNLHSHDGITICLVNWW